MLSGSGIQKVGVKKALVFYGGKPPKGIKTNWVMHEYRLIPDRNKTKPPDLLANKKGSARVIYLLYTHTVIYQHYRFVNKFIELIDWGFDL